MHCKLLLTFICTFLAVNCSERPMASSYVFRSYDASPGQVVYLSPARSRIVYPSFSQREKIKMKANLDQTEESSEETGKVEDSDEEDPKVRHLQEPNYSSDTDESSEKQLNSKKNEHRKGFNSKHRLKKGKNGYYANENHSHSYAGKGDRMKSYHDEDSYHKDHHDEAHRNHGGKHSEKKYHKKGSKTTGYHNIYHKDEYKKEKIFYDTADHTRHYKKYGSSHKEHSNDEGDFSKGGRRKESHWERKKSYKGHSDDGKYDANHEQFQKARNATSGYRNREQFERNDGNYGSNAHGYKIYHE
ncbi:uncharacterized protein LOC131439142 [Malaya genurostris]|uniref:uncharacterized protein LOC131439142 n=1 Tax=Malaya genurostris TaxID=325434 RepID=UPI0026F3FB67|nr:uncharacterized protein LOC131439142 [Malaya genurostris]